jgi:23S rRNA maturation mini-RNase III
MTNLRDTPIESLLGFLYLPDFIANLPEFLQKE